MDKTEAPSDPEAAPKIEEERKSEEVFQEARKTKITGGGEAGLKRKKTTKKKAK